MHTPPPSHRHFHRHGLDRLAILLSGLCLVHCLGFPVLIAFLPALSGVLPRQWWVHPAILSVALPLAVLALRRGWQRSRDPMPSLVGGIGLVFLIAGVAVREGSAAETVLTVTGGVVLASGHLLNWQLGRRHAGCCDPAGG